MAIYMKYGSIKGDATQGKHNEWITITSVQLGVGRGISTPVGSSQNREASEPSISEVTVTKPLDSSSVLLFQDSTVGTKGEEVTIHFCRTDKEGAEYLELKLYNTLLSGFSMSSGGDAPSESISLNFTKIDVNEMGPNEKNTPGNPIKFTYDIATGGKS